MPSASDELREKMVKRFGSIDTHGPEEALKKSGYVLRSDWTWVPPVSVVQAAQTRQRAVVDVMTQDDYDCFWFLITEWDYAGLAPVNLEGGAA